LEFEYSIHGYGILVADSASPFLAGGSWRETVRLLSVDRLGEEDIELA